MWTFFKRSQTPTIFKAVSDQTASPNLISDGLPIKQPDVVAYLITFRLKATYNNILWIRDYFWAIIHYVIMERTTSRYIIPNLGLEHNFASIALSGYSSVTMQSFAFNKHLTKSSFGLFAYIQEWQEQMKEDIVIHL